MTINDKCDVIGKGGSALPVNYFVNFGLPIRLCVFCALWR